MSSKTRPFYSRLPRLAGRMLNMAKLLSIVAPFSLLLLGLSAHGATISLFPTGTTVDLTIQTSTAPPAILSSDVRGLAGAVVTNPPIASGVLIGDFGLLPPPGNHRLIATDAATLIQALLLTLDINALVAGGPGILVPVSVLALTPISDPALQEFNLPLIFGFSIASINVDPLNNTTDYVLNLATIEQAVP